MKQTQTPAVLAPYGSTAALPLAAKVGIAKVDSKESHARVPRKVVRRRAR